jgi:hypothetical protein
MVTTKKEILGTLRHRGTVYMSVGYPQDHSDNAYRLISDKIRKIENSREIIWLYKNYDSWVSKEQENKNEFIDPIGDNHSDATTNNFMSQKDLEKWKDRATYFL